jgi:archaellum component FlaF (FlaF/FlaG flagellin family)
MAHKTLINGTAYKVKNGKTLINGTSYKIKNGKTLVNGTSYKVDFYVPMYTITITINDAGNLYDLRINGVQYNYATTVTVPHGTEVNCTVTGDSTKNITLNGRRVSQDSYIYTVTRNLAIELDISHSILSGDTWGEIKITEL